MKRKNKFLLIFTLLSTLFPASGVFDGWGNTILHHVADSKGVALFDIDGDSRVFFLQEVEDERYEVIFGDGVFGKKLYEGNVATINYIKTNGDSGNGVSGFAFIGQLQYTRNATTYPVSSGISMSVTGVQGARKGSETKPRNMNVVFVMKVC